MLVFPPGCNLKSCEALCMYSLVITLNHSELRTISQGQLFQVMHIRFEKELTWSTSGYLTIWTDTTTHRCLLAADTSRTLVGTRCLLGWARSKCVRRMLLSSKGELGDFVALWWWLFKWFISRDTSADAHFMVDSCDRVCRIWYDKLAGPKWLSCYVTYPHAVPCMCDCNCQLCDVNFALFMSAHGFYNKHLRNYPGS